MSPTGEFSLVDTIFSCLVSFVHALLVAYFSGSVVFSVRGLRFFVFVSSSPLVAFSQLRFSRTWVSLWWVLALLHWVLVLWWIQNGGTSTMARAPCTTPPFCIAQVVRY